MINKDMSQVYKMTNGDLKITDVLPIFIKDAEKKDSKNSKNLRTYRPVSALPDL